MYASSNEDEGIKVVQARSKAGYNEQGSSIGVLYDNTTAETLIVVACEERT